MMKYIVILQAFQEKIVILSGCRLLITALKHIIIFYSFHYNILFEDKITSF